MQTITRIILILVGIGLLAAGYGMIMWADWGTAGGVVFFIGLIILGIGTRFKKRWG